MYSITAITLAAIALSAEAFAPNSRVTHVSRSSPTQVNGLFDGMKEAFSAPALERSNLDSERETPIDRWMGWNVKKEVETVQGTKGASSV